MPTPNYTSVGVMNVDVGKGLEYKLQFAVFSSPLPTTTLQRIRLCVLCDNLISQHAVPPSQV